MLQKIVRCGFESLQYETKSLIPRCRHRSAGVASKPLHTERNSPVDMRQHYCLQARFWKHLTQQGLGALHKQTWWTNRRERTNCSNWQWRWTCMAPWSCREWSPHHHRPLILFLTICSTGVGGLIGQSVRSWWPSWPGNWLPMAYRWHEAAIACRWRCQLEAADASKRCRRHVKGDRDNSTIIS